MDFISLHKKAGEHTEKYIQVIKEDQWNKLSNCAPWTVKDLLNHLVSENLWVKPLMEGKTVAEVGEQFEGDMLREDPLESWKTSLSEANQAFSEAGALKKNVHLSYGDVPALEYCGHRIIDLVIHGWDLAVSTGQEDTLPEDLVEAAYAILKPQLEGFQGSGLFGTEVKVAENAPLQDKLLGVLGRDRKSPLKQGNR